MDSQSSILSYQNSSEQIKIYQIYNNLHKESWPCEFNIQN